MKKNKALLLLCLILGVVFLLQFAGELFFALGKDKIPEKGLKYVRAAMKLFPIESAFPGEAGYALVETGIRDNDAAAIKASIPYFIAAIGRNPVDHRSRYYLAKAYLQFSAVENDYFELGVAELRRAARIRGSNKQIALDCVKVFFSLWPLLEKEDQEFTANLLRNAMPAMSWEEFSPLLEMWTLYVQDSGLLQDILAVRPDFYGPGANQLVAAGIPLSWRWQLLDLYENYSLDASERLYNEKLLRNEMDGEQARNILSHLRVSGYFRLHPGSRLSVDKLLRLQRQLLLEIISGQLSAPESHEEPKPALQLRGDIQRYVDDQGDLNSLGELYKLLEEKGFFKGNDFSSLRLKILINYKKGDYNGVVSEVEALRKSISFIKKEQAADYTAILLLLVDSYYRTKLLTAAEQVAAELVREQPDNPDVLWRVLRVQKIMGSEGASDPALQEKLAKVENSRFVTVLKPQASFDVYLFNQPWIEIAMDPALIATLKPQQLIQVYVDGRIAFESYANGLPPKIAIGPPFVEIESKVTIRVNIL